MAASLQILIYSVPEAVEVIDQSSLIAAGYEVTPVTRPEAVEAWIKTFHVEALLIIVHPDASEGLSYAAELLSIFPNLPIILITNKASISNLKQALEIGLIDCLTIPVDKYALLRTIQRNLDNRKYIQEWSHLARALADHEDGILLADGDGHLILINQAVRNIFSLGGEQVEGKLVSDVIQHPDLLAIFMPQTVFPQRREITLEDGRVYSAHASLISENGIAIVMQEITHLKELDRIKTDFVNTVSHDLRSPLTAIYGFVGLIDRVGPINAQQAEFIRHIQSSVQHITSLINDLMDLDRLEAGYDLQMEEVNLKEIVTQSIEDLDYQMNEKMQELMLSFPAEVPIILGNPLHLQRMITNLIENAIKFTPPLGKISVRCRAEANQLILEVADNGPGIPLDDQPHIYEKFYRGSNLSPNTSGTGLGLSIVQSILEKHHGRIWLESSPAGTTFTVILPTKQ